MVLVQKELHDLVDVLVKALPPAHFRFGMSLSALRTDMLEQTRAEAVKWVKLAGTACHAVGLNEADNPLWVKHANLKPVLDLASTKPN